MNESGAPSAYALPAALRLAPSRRKWTRMLVAATAFALAGIWIAHGNALVGYSCAAFFGVGAIVAAANLHPGSSYLLVDASGFTFASLFRKHIIPWSQVKGFVPIRVNTMLMVGWNYTLEHKGAQKLRSLNTTLAGAEAALPDTYGKSAAELIELLEGYRSRYRSPPL